MIWLATSSQCPQSTPVTTQIVVEMTSESYERRGGTSSSKLVYKNFFGNLRRILFMRP